MSLKKQKCFSQCDKLKIIKAHEAGKTRSEIMREYGLPLSSFYRIMRQKDSIVQQCLRGNGSLRRNRGAEFPHIERCMLEWLHQRLDYRISIEGPLIKAQAKLFSTKLGIEDFSASNGWLHGFKRRHGLSFNKSQQDEFGQEIPTAEWASCFTSLLNEYGTEDIYSLAETGLFYGCLPEQVDSYRGKDFCDGENCNKRVTVLLCANVAGTDKLPVFVIGRLDRNKCLKEIPTPSNAMYHSNWNAWITRDIFQAWLRKVDQTMREAHRQIVLLVNHSPVHVILHNLTNVKVIFYTTNQAQPPPPHNKLIHAFKRSFRTTLIAHLLECRKNGVVPDISIPYTVVNAAQAWDTISCLTIMNCFMLEASHNGSSDSSQLDEKEDVIWPHEADRIIFKQQSSIPNFVDYVQIDMSVAVSGMLTDDNIVEMVMNQQHTEEVSEEDSAMDSDKLNTTVKKGKKRKNSLTTVTECRQQATAMAKEFVAGHTKSNETVVEQQSQIRKEDALDAIKKLHQFFERHSDTKGSTFHMLYELEKCVQSVKM